MNVDDLCKMFVDVAITGFNAKSGDVSEKASNLSVKILEKAKEKKKSSYETTNSLLTHMGLIKVQQKTQVDLGPNYLFLRTRRLADTKRRI